VTTRERTGLWRIADQPEAAGLEPRPAINAVSGLLIDAHAHAEQLYEAEQLADETWEVDDLDDAEIRVADAEGRTIVAARLEREPGTNRFTILLLLVDPTEPAE